MDQYKRIMTLAAVTIGYQVASGQASPCDDPCLRWDPDCRWYNPWHPNSDWDDDGIPNKDDPDWDGDGIPNCEDTGWPDDPCQMIIPPSWCNDNSTPGGTETGLGGGIGGGGGGGLNPCWLRDDDGDGIPNVNDPDSVCFDPFHPDSDRDCDGIPNNQDPDDDDDGIWDQNDPDGPDYNPVDPGSDFDGDGIINADDCDDDGDGLCDDCDSSPWDCSDATPVTGGDCDIDVDQNGQPDVCDECFGNEPEPPDDGDDSGDGGGPGPGGGYPGDTPPTDPPTTDPPGPPGPPNGPPDDPPPFPPPPENEPPLDDLCCIAIVERLEDIQVVLNRLDYFADNIANNTYATDQYLRYLGGRMVTDSDSWRNLQLNQLGHMDQLLVYITGQLADLSNQLNGTGGVVPGAFSGTVPGENGEVNTTLDGLAASVTEQLKPTLPVIPPSETSPPVWDLSFDPGTFVSGWTGGAFNIVVDWSNFTLIRTLLHAVILSMGTLGGMHMVWEELRRYG
jgi:hypothetical protein